MEGQRTDDNDGTNDGTDGHTEDDDGDDGTRRDTTRRTDRGQNHNKSQQIIKNSSYENCSHFWTFFQKLKKL